MRKTNHEYPRYNDLERTFGNFKIKIFSKYTFRTIDSYTEIKLFTQT